MNFFFLLFVGLAFSTSGRAVDQKIKNDVSNQGYSIFHDMSECPFSQDEIKRSLLFLMILRIPVKGKVERLTLQAIKRY